MNSPGALHLPIQMLLPSALNPGKLTSKGRLTSGFCWLQAISMSRLISGTVLGTSSLASAQHILCSSFWDLGFLLDGSSPLAIEPLSSGNTTSLPLKQRLPSTTHSGHFAIPVGPLNIYISLFIYEKIPYGLPKLVCLTSSLCSNMRLEANHRIAL